MALIDLIEFLQDFPYIYRNMEFMRLCLILVRLHQKYNRVISDFFVNAKFPTFSDNILFLQ